MSQTRKRLSHERNALFVNSTNYNDPQKTRRMRSTIGEKTALIILMFVDDDPAHSHCFHLQGARNSYDKLWTDEIPVLNLVSCLVSFASTFEMMESCQEKCFEGRLRLGSISSLIRWIVYNS
jgi:hypothetical protein